MSISPAGSCTNKGQIPDHANSFDDGAMYVPVIASLAKDDLYQPKMLDSPELSSHSGLSRIELSDNILQTFAAIKMQTEFNERYPEGSTGRIDAINKLHQIALAENQALDRIQSTPSSGLSKVISHNDGGHKH